MMEHKRNWIRLLMLALCAVLLGAVLWQGQKISVLEKKLSGVEEALIYNADSTNEQLYDLYSAVEELQSVPERPSLRFQNSTVNTEDHTLTVEIMAEIPGEEDYYATIGLCRVGEPYSLSWECESLERTEDSSFHGTVTFPLDLEMGLEVRMENDAVLYSSETIVPLLPLQMKYGGASIHHNSTDGIFSLCDLAPALTDLAGEPACGVDGVYRLYRNEKEAASFPEGPDGNLAGAPVGNDSISLPCGLGDRIRLTYTCADEFGLRYVFQLGEWEMVKWDGTRNCLLPPRVAVSWPE